MTEDTIVAWKVGADDSEVTLYNSNIIVEDFDSLQLSGIVADSEVKGRKDAKKMETYSEICQENVFRVNSGTSYGSIGSVGSSAGDEQGDGRGLVRKESTLSTVSNLSDQPYIALMSQVSRDRKQSSLSSDGSLRSRKVSEGSVRSRKVSEGLSPSPFISMIGQHGPATHDSSVMKSIDEQCWVDKNQIYGNEKKIYSRNFQIREKMRIRGEIFPGYEKTIQERTNKPVQEKKTTEEDKQKESPADVKEDTVDQRRLSFNPTQNSESMEIEETGSEPNLESHFRRKGARATFCSSEIKSRSQHSSHVKSSSINPVTRSQSMRKPLQKIGDGFLKTFRHLKKK